MKRQRTVREKNINVCYIWIGDAYMTQKQLTIRGIPEQVDKEIRKESRKRGVSLNKAAIALLQKSVSGLGSKRPELHHDLDRLAGKWSKDEAKAFDETLGSQRKIDEELWR